MQNRLWVFLGTSLLVSGFYYFLFRYEGLPGDPTGGTFPSFIFVLSFTVLPRLTAPARSWPGRELQSAVWLLATLFFEPLLGTFDPADVGAAVLAYMLALPLSHAIGGNESPIAAGKGFHLLVIASGLFFIIGSEEFCEEDGCGYLVDPVYMSYEDLRSAVKVTEPRAMSAVGSFVLYGDYILMNERNQGVHVIDNRDPANPQAIGFIEIPGNTSLVVRDDIIFADSFIDLVAIDASEAGNVHEVARQLEVFPYNPYQAIDDDIQLDTWDSEKGVVIGYD